MEFAYYLITLIFIYCIPYRNFSESSTMQIDNPLLLCTFTLKSKIDYHSHLSCSEINLMKCSQLYSYFKIQNLSSSLTIKSHQSAILLQSNA